jgi:hypothetical protein
MRFLLLFPLVYIANFLSFSCFGQDTLALERPVLRSSVSKLSVEILGVSLTHERRLSYTNSTSFEGQFVYDFGYRFHPGILQTGLIRG